MTYNFLASSIFSLELPVSFFSLYSTRTDVVMGDWNMYLPYYQPRFAPQHLNTLRTAHTNGTGKSR